MEFMSAGGNAPSVNGFALQNNLEAGIIITLPRKLTVILAARDAGIGLVEIYNL